MSNKKISPWQDLPNDVTFRSLSSQEKENVGLSPSGGSKTAVFNVGGKYYEVSRSLLEQGIAKNSMLSRLISETWCGEYNINNKNSNNNSESSRGIYIDRDPDRFAFVLDYLRYGEVLLPDVISFQGFMMDMDFYGVEVLAGTVGREIEYPASRAQELKRSIRQSKDKRHRLENEKEHMVFAAKLFIEYVKGENMKSSIFVESEDYPPYFRQDLLNQYLSVYGLHAKKSYNHYYKKNMFFFTMLH
eukprot:CAMPEP_0172512022 /NCGR_PEP_ID=MMETSP1066-20121228/241077_1 /TAXON_ID=671091 /ORGANISM="Coscinodiscus wailesii, Strain CCMP2513" /LENGTH=244 /DNA_ID=CAMNT_0013291635 /DNA_START=85 /DNA_END=819 /DNA_ORIENTATION=+